jgi:small subunit ribosomal protein S1
MEEAERAEARRQAEEKAQEAVEEVEAQEESETASDADADTAEQAEDEADAGAALTGPIPDDFPLASRLEAAGVTTFEELLDVDDLTELSGIGPAYADQIQEAIDARQ